MNQMEKWKVYRCECGHVRYDHADESDEVPTGTGRCSHSGCGCQHFKKRPISLDELTAFIKELHLNNSYHIKRGFRLQDVSIFKTSNHMIEETVELQAEAAENNREGIIEESSDVLATWMHLLLYCDVDFKEVIDKCANKLLKTFTNDPDDVLTSNPGFSRRHRDPSYNARTSAIGGPPEKIDIQDETS